MQTAARRWIMRLGVLALLAAAAWLARVTVLAPQPLHVSTVPV
jgi:hypothetical protein